MDGDTLVARCEYRSRKSDARAGEVGRHRLECVRYLTFGAQALDETDRSRVPYFSDGS